MSESSLLVSRTWDPESQLGSKEQIELSEPTPKDRILKEREVAIALLRFLQLLFELADVGVHPSLEPVRHEETIGEGLSFSVKKYKKGRHVLKVFKQSLASGDTGKFDHDGFEALMKEAYILGSLRHENVMKMTEITWTVIGHEPLQIAPALIIERSPYGDLSKFQTSQKNVTWKMRKMLCYDVAVGLEFLHRSGVVHGDIKGENVLIFDHETRGYLAKLSDFGSAIIVGTSSSGGPDRKVRLPAYTRPWNAPEAKESLLASTIHLTDIWSLGLLIWRILMHGDPFRSFDLPLHPATRVAMIERLLAFKRNGSYLAGFVAAEGGLEFSDLSDVVLLTGIFAVTLDREPQNRSLGTVLELLNAHSGRPASRANAFKSVVLRKLDPLPTEIHRVDMPLSWIKGFHFLVQTQIILALEEFCGYGALRRGGKPHPVLLTTTLLHESMLWKIFYAHLLGIGTKADAQFAMDILYTAGLKENGRFWKSLALTEVLHRALGLHIPQERERQIVGVGSASPFYHRVMESELPTNKAEHGILLDKKDLLEAYQCLAGRANEAQFANRIRTIQQVHVGGGNTLLHAVALYGMLDLARVLINDEDIPIDINCVNDHGETALLIACRWGSYDVLHLLLDNNADASICNYQGENGLYWLGRLPQQSAAYTAKRLEKYGASLQFDSTFNRLGCLDLVPDSFYHDGKTRAGHCGPLVRAVGNRDLHSITILLEIYRQLCKTEKPCNTMISILMLPLKLGAEFHFYEILELFCAELLAIMNDGATEGNVRGAKSVGPMVTRLSMFYSITSGAFNMSHHVHRLCLHGIKWKDACKKTIEVLHAFGFIPSHLVYNGLPTRILNYAVVCRNPEAVTVLLDIPEFLPLINKVDEILHRPPVEEALISVQFNIFQHLVDKGATIDIQKNRSQSHTLTTFEASYLHLIASLRIEDFSFTNLILSMGVPVNTADKQGCTAFSVALYRGCFRLAKMLLEKGIDLQTPGYLSLPPLAEFMTYGAAKQCDDWLATVKFLLQHDPGQGTLFVVDRKQGMSVLHVTALYPNTDIDLYTDYRSVMETLVRHFNSPGQIDAKATELKLTPLQCAVSASNPVAVLALLRAGADINARDPSGGSMMKMAKNNVNQLIASGQLTNSKRSVDRALECVSILANHGSWPEDFESGAQVTKALQAVKPLLDKMLRITHLECNVLGLETQALDLLQTHLFAKPVARNISAMATMQREINSIIQPLFYIEVCAGVFANRVAAAQRMDTYSSIVERMHWWKTLEKSRFGEYQQSAAFEWFLDEVRQRKEDNSLSKFAETGNRQQLPYDYRSIRWPMSLLDWYVRAVREDQMIVAPEEQLEIEAFIQILRTRRTMQQQGKFPLPDLGERFRHIHFELLQATKLGYETHTLVLGAEYRCRCFHQRIGRINVVALENLVVETANGIEIQKTISSDWVTEELEKWGANKLWKERVGVNGEEGRGWDTGLWRHASTKSEKDGQVKN